MEVDTGLPLNQLRADGGASRDRFLMQFQADILERTVRRPGDSGDHRPGRRLSGRSGRRAVAGSGRIAAAVDL